MRGRTRKVRVKAKASRRRSGRSRKQRGGSIGAREINKYAVIIQKPSEKGEGGVEL